MLWAWPFVTFSLNFLLLCSHFTEVKGEPSAENDSESLVNRISSAEARLVIRRERSSEDYQADYQSDYQADGRFENDPQFPTYSNWQPADQLGTFRINSPRLPDSDQEEDDPFPAGPPPPPGKKKVKNNDFISVKLPDDIMQHLGKQFGGGGNDHVQKQILGIPSDHLETLNFDEDKNQKTESRSTSDTTTASTTTKKQDFHDSYQTKQQEYYNKKDFLPKLSKKTKDGEGVKTPEQNPVESERRSLWSVAWQAHIWFSGTLFILLAVYCTVNVCRLHTFSRLFSRGYFLSLNISMILIGLVRGLFLLIDPYNEEQTLPTPLAYMLLNIGYPCITSAFSILFLALLRVTQVELLSPAVQTPRALAVFCCLHISISLALDITVGLMSRLQYILLLGQGIFIVWSLLLSAGYFYIYSTMKKVVSRQQCDINRSMYPKLMFDQTGSGSYSMRLPVSQSNPLARAVNLTLGVAVIGSLMGGVQLYGMIGMHGLLRSDPSQIPTPWYGYQVALRVLEVMICYLLAVVATTPLRHDTGASPRSSRGPCSSCSPLLCCNGEGPCVRCGAGDTHRSQLEEEIYTEICANNVESYTQAMLPLGTQTSANNSSLALSTSGTQLTSTLARKLQPVAIRNSGGCGSHISGESNVTQDTALYSNLRTNSRPSSMLFNDAGFVRFRIGNDQSELRQSCEDLVQEETGDMAGSENPMKGSRSFDNSVLDKKQLSGESFRQSPLERPQSNMSHVKDVGDSRLIKSELCSPDRPDVEFLPGLPQRPASKLATHSHPAARRESESDTGGEQYETPAGMILPGVSRSLAAQVRSVVGYSESDLSSVDPLYAGRSIYGYGRAPSRCSSISATQSFDMRVYGRTGFNGSGAATLGRPVDKSKLDNKYYYYGSSKGQKNAGAKETLTPRPLLPSQRSRDPRFGPSPTPPTVQKAQVTTSTPAQSLYDQIMGREQQSPKLTNFQRSRSLGHHYQRGEPAGDAGANLPPRPPGHRTPTSVARKVFESVTKRRNKEKAKGRPEPSVGYMTAPGPLMQTPDGRLVPAGPLIQLEDGRVVPAPGPLVQLEDGRIMALAQPSGLLQTPDGRLVMAGTRARQVAQDRDQMLYGTREEILTNREAYNQAHALGLLGDKLSYLPGEDPMMGRAAYGGRGEVRQVLGTPTSGRHNHQAAARLAGQHFLASPPDIHSARRGERLEGGEDPDLADTEVDSEISSLFGGERDLRDPRLQNLHLMSPLEYAARPGILGQDITPDSGVVMDSRLHSRERENQDVKSKRDNFLASSRMVAAAKNEVANESTESSDSSSFGSRGKNDSLLHRNGRYIRVPTNEDHLERVRDESKESKREIVGSNRDTELPAFIWDGSKLVPSDPRTLARRHRQPSSLSEAELVTDSEAVSEATENSADGAGLSEPEPEGAELHPAAEKIATVCNEIKQRFHTERLNTDDENVI